MTDFVRLKVHAFSYIRKIPVNNSCNFSSSLTIYPIFPSPVTIYSIIPSPLTIYPYCFILVMKRIFLKNSFRHFFVFIVILIRQMIRKMYWANPKEPALPTDRQTGRAEFKGPPAKTGDSKT